MGGETVRPLSGQFEFWPVQWHLGLAFELNEVSSSVCVFALGLSRECKIRVVALYQI